MASHRLRKVGGTQFANVTLELSSGIVLILEHAEEATMNSIIYIIGFIVVIGLILSFFGLR